MTVDESFKDIESNGLVNRGFHVLRPSPPDLRERTVIVLGVPRGGTSMVASVLHALGIPMGDKHDRVVFEDIDIARALELGDISQLKRLIAARDSRHAIWGLKRAGASEQISQLKGLFRNPHFVVPFRDLLAIAMRNEISVQIDPLENMADSLLKYEATLSFIKELDAPIFLLSYEKALLKRKYFVEALADFSGVTSAERIASAIEAVEVDSPEYLEISRITKALGYLGAMTRERIAGWAKPFHGDRPLVVELYVNGKKSAETVADRYRNDLKEKNVHPTGKCGFLFVLDEDNHLQEGDLVSVKAKDDIRDLISSPRIFESSPG